MIMNNILWNSVIKNSNTFAPGVSRTIKHNHLNVRKYTHINRNHVDAWRYRLNNVQVEWNGSYESLFGSTFLCRRIMMNVRKSNSFYQNGNNSTRYNKRTSHRLPASDESSASAVGDFFGLTGHIHKRFRGPNNNENSMSLSLSSWIKYSWIVFTERDRNTARWS